MRMPLKLPELDDRRYADLVEEALAMIPAYSPEWTNHNASDPGITLVELLAYFTEMLVFQVNQITDESRKMFLRLINGPEGQLLDNCGQNSAASDSGERTLPEQIREAVRKVRLKDRAVSAEDFERLAREEVDGVDRAKCLPRRVLRNEDPRAWSFERAGHVSVIVIPKSKDEEALVIQRVKHYLEPRRLLTTRVHVVGPRFLRLSVRPTLVVETGTHLHEVAKSAVTALRQFFDFRTWPFGRNVYLAEVYQLLDNVEGVDYVTDIEITGVTEGQRLKRNSQGEVIAVEVRPDELVEAHIEPEHIHCEPPACPTRAQIQP
jgi:hypothetical protein